MLVHKKSTNISIFSLIILVRILIFCEALVLSNLKNFFDFPNVHFLEMKGFALAVFLNYKNARVIFIFQTVFENWILNVFGNWIVWIKFWNIKLLYYIRKEIIQSLCCFRFRCEHLFIFSQIYFLSGYWLVREQRFYCFPKFLIIYNIFLIQVLVIFFSSFFSREAHMYSFVLHEACGFLLFSFVKSSFSALTFWLFLFRVFLL